MNAHPPTRLALRGIRLGGLLLLVALSACVAPERKPIQVEAVFIDNLLRCALPCAPFSVAVACQAPRHLICKCASGEKWDVDLPEPAPVPKPQGYARPPGLPERLWPLRRAARARA